MRRESVQSLERALSILVLLSRSDGPVGVTRLAVQLDLAKSTVHRLLSTLQRTGFAYRTPEGKYGLGVRLWEIGCAAVRKLRVRDAARPIMRRVAAELGETVCLAAWDSREAVYIETVDGKEPITLRAGAGVRVPPHATAAGLVLLAHQPAEAQEAVCRDLENVAETTVTDPEQLRTRLEEVRRQGYAFSNGAWNPGVGAVAAPVRSPRGEVIAALVIASPAERLARRVPEVARLVRTTADEISAALADHDAAAEDLPPGS